MNTTLIQETALNTLAGTISFPDVVGQLLRAGVEYYHVDYVALRKTYYAADGSAVVTLPLNYEDLPSVAADFDVAALRANILDSQTKGQSFHDFSRRATAAGVQGYFAFLRGKRVTYLGRQGDQHIEWFPRHRALTIHGVGGHDLLGPSVAAQRGGHNKSAMASGSQFSVENQRGESSHCRVVEGMEPPPRRTSPQGAAGNGVGQVPSRPRKPRAGSSPHQIGQHKLTGFRPDWESL